MKTLDEICLEQGTDKASIHPYKGHDYARRYDEVFIPIRDTAHKILEIGVGGAQSIRSWLEYFSNANVFGVDNVKDTNPWNTVGANPHARYTFVWGDQSDATFWSCFTANHGTDWDVIIDDGGHFNDQVITTFVSLWAAVRAGGYYCIEDLGVCYGTSSIFVRHGLPSQMAFIKGKLDEINTADDIDSLRFSKELAIFRKK
jgi:hypothetical protein